MPGQTLQNPPLVEAIFELRWQLEEPKPGIGYDPYYSLLIGRLSQQLEGTYPFHEPLPAAAMPSEVIAGVVQHRFRSGKDQWPLVQLGPGVFTINAVDGYTWDDFEQRIHQGVGALLSAYPKDQEININRFQLRYINGVELDFGETDIYEFLQSQMRTQLVLCPPLFEETGVDKTPLGLDLRFTFGCTKPNAILNFRLVRGQKRNADALIWETIISTHPEHVPDVPAKMECWLRDAHDIAEHWFFRLVEGDLLRRFE